MSALDQAFIKAYAKDQPVAKAAPAVARERAIPRAEPQPAARSGAGAGVIDQLYQGGSLYRVERPVAAIATGARAVPQPHVKLLPPTSPRRSVRRSLLRLLANQPAETPLSESDGSPPRVARKVIIRHIAHAAAPAPLGLLRTAAPAPLPILPSEIDELSPETIADEPPAAPLPSQPAPLSIPVTPTAAPSPMPLNRALHVAAPLTSPPITIHAPWELAESAAGLVLLAEPAEFALAGPDSLVAVQLEALHLPEPRPAAAIEPEVVESEVVESQNVEIGDSHAEAAMTRFAAKALDHVDEPELALRHDAPHVRSSHRPHLKFTPVPAEPAETLAAEPAETLAAVVEPDPVAEVIGEPIAAKPLTIDELTIAETNADLEIDEAALISDQANASAGATAERDAEPAQAASPLWEVDRFHWPKTCEKLLSAEGSYFRHAGEKLVAAVRDGLKVLAITGSRRGEGRTTLALCLARVAAEAGVQTAIMDADFARPQLASKIGLEIAYGWQDAAMGKIPLSEAAVKSLADNVTALPLETSAAGARLSLADPRVTATIRAAAATFELLILDLGPVGHGAEIAFPDGERCPLDAAIVVRDLRFATLSESEAIGHALSDAGIEAVGIAENFVVEEEVPHTSV